MTQRMTTRKILVDALGVLGPNGENWIKHDFARDGRYCMVGAVNKVAIGNAAQMMPMFSPGKQHNEIDPARPSPAIPAPGNRGDRWLAGRLERLQRPEVLRGGASVPGRNRDGPRG